MLVNPEQNVKVRCTQWRDEVLPAHEKGALVSQKTHLWFPVVFLYMLTGHNSQPAKPGDSCDPCTHTQSAEEWLPGGDTEFAGRCTHGPPRAYGRGMPGGYSAAGATLLSVRYVPTGHTEHVLGTVSEVPLGHGGSRVRPV